MRRFTTSLFLALSLLIGMSAVASAQFATPEAGGEYPAGTVGTASAFYFSDDLIGSADAGTMIFLYFELKDEEAAVSLYETGVDEALAEGDLQESPLELDSRTDDVMLWQGVDSEDGPSGVLMLREGAYVGYWVYTVEDGDSILRDIYDDLFAEGFDPNHLFPEGDQIPEGLTKAD